MAATLYQIWQHHHKGDFAAGVRLLVEHNPGAVTRNTLSRLQKLVFTGEPANDYERGKLSDALQKIEINPTPDPSPEGRGDVANTVEPPATSARPASPAKTNETPASSTSPLQGSGVQTTEQSTADSPASSTSPLQGSGVQTTEQSTVPFTASSTASSTADSTEHSTPPLPSGEGSGVGLTSPLAKSLHKEHAHIHALMVTAKTDAERARYAKDIMERIIPALDAEYDRLRAAAAHADSQDTAAAEDGEDGIVETGRPILNRADAATLKKLQSVRSRISVLKKKIPGEKDAKRKEKLQAELTQKQAEKDRLEKELS